MNSKDTKLLYRLLKLLYDHNEEHIGSCFATLDVLDRIYDRKNPDDIVILSNGHAAYALYVVLEKYYDIDADYLVKKHLGHPNRDIEDKIYCSTGSLGQGITVGVGAALASPDKKVFVTISDGECSEGSVWESLAFIHKMNLTNIEITAIINGYAGYEAVDREYLKNRLKSFLPNINFHEVDNDEISFIKNLEAHYIKLDEEMYKKALIELDKKYEHT